MEAISADLAWVRFRGYDDGKTTVTAVGGPGLNSAGAQSGESLRRAPTDGTEWGGGGVNAGRTETS